MKVLMIETDNQIMTLAQSVEHWHDDLEVLGFNPQWKRKVFADFLSPCKLLLTTLSTLYNLAKTRMMSTQFTH